MNLKELRLKSKMTQQETSKYLNVPLRTYSRYENDMKYESSLSYKKMCEMMEEYTRIDESHGILKIDEILVIIRPILIKYNIEICYLFGSYSKNQAREESDIDLMISSNITGLDYYGLLQELMDGLHKKVDLIKLDQASKNITLLEEIFKSGINVYGEFKK